MKCPKCHYLSFEPEARCRNCGFDLTVSEADLVLRAAEEVTGQPPVDLTLRVAAPASAPVELKNAPLVVPAPTDPPIDGPIEGRQPSPDSQAASLSSATAEPRPPAAEVRPRPPAGPSDPVRAPGPAPRTAAAPRRVARPHTPTPRPRPKPAPTTDLPLFMKGPAPAPPATPATTTARPPLVVQRRTAEPGGAAPSASSPPRRLGPFDRDLLEDLQRIERAERQRATAPVGRTGEGAADAGSTMARLKAAVLDVTVLAGICAVVTWLTLRWCGLSMADLAMLPMVPLTAFLGLLTVGYLMLFTAAGGQTIGKMASGIRVVAGDEPASGSAALTVAQSALRAALTLPSVLAFGAGFVPGLLGEHRAFHDRVAHTRVVRA